MENLMERCTNWCCDEKAREAMLADEAAARMLRRAEFARWRAQRNGQTVDRVVRVDILPDLHVVEPYVPRPGITDAETWKAALTGRCGCTDCRCDNGLTIDHPRRCRDCDFGMHQKAA